MLVKLGQMGEYVDFLKKLMGVRLAPGPEHPLFGHFTEWEIHSNRLISSSAGPSEKVLELARLGAYFFHAQDQLRSREKTRAYVRTKLMSCDEANFWGFVFEFKTVMHFMHLHRDVRWIPNRESSEEYDLVIGSNPEVYVECCRVKPNEFRVESAENFGADLGMRVLENRKRVQIERATGPLIVVVYYPQEINWIEMVKGWDMNSVIISVLSEPGREFISGLILLADIPQPITLTDDGDQIYETKVLPLGGSNAGAKYPLPEGLRLMG